MLVIPAIDLLEGKAVRLRQGRYDAVTVYDDNPLGRATTFRQHAQRLHLVDLEGAREGRAVQRDLVRQLARAFGKGVQIGGGVRTREAFESYLELGVERVILGSAAVTNPALVRELSTAYPQRVILAVDAHDGWVATEGWTQASKVTAIDLARSFGDVPIASVLYTDIARDGMGTGPNLAATVSLAKAISFPVLASGGVGNAGHIADLAKEGILEGVIVGRALYDGSLTLEDAVRAASPPAP